MLVKKLGDAGKYFTLEDPEGTVSFLLPDSISLRIEDLHQLFKNPRGLNYRQLPLVFNSMERVMDAAVCYTEGITNPQKFIKIVTDTEFCRKHNLTKEDQCFLKDFITKTRLKPPSVVQQLYMKGYKRIADDMDFSDPTPELNMTCKVFLEFIEKVREQNL